MPLRFPTSLALAALSACKASGDGRPAAPPPAPPPAVAAASAPMPSDAAQVLSRLDIDRLAPAQREALWALAQDEVCYCGCPHSLAGCLREHKNCRHAVRMGNLAIREMSEAGPGAAQATLLAYYASFPKARRTQLPLEGIPLRGPADAKVKIAIFSDFQCPYCGMVAPMLEQIVDKFKGKVSVHYLHFPLPGHPRSEAAAQASEYAREKGKFWEMHDLIFKNAFMLEDEDLASYAKQIGLDGAELVKAVAAGKYKDRVQAQRTAGETLGLRGTPGIIVNGRPLTLRPTGENLMHAIEDELEFQSNGEAWAKD